MTITQANEIIRKYYDISMPTQEDDFQYIEASEYIINETKDSDRMLHLGGWYYERKIFDLALKYYELAAEYKNTDAYCALGYVWYYGRTGERDYDKAFKYYSLAADAGDLEAAYKVADMYKNGYSVKQDYEKYKEIIEDLYDQVKYETRLFAPVPQICIRLARIRKEESDMREAYKLLTYAKNFLAQRLQYNHFFGDLTNMRWIISELYDIVAFDSDNFDVYDLFYILKEPHKVSFDFEGKTYIVESKIEDDECVICFNDKWYRNIDDFFNKAYLKEYHLTEIYNYLDNFEVI